MRDRCQETIDRDYEHDDTIGTFNESRTAKSVSCTAAVARKYNGNRGKVENCTVGVHLGYWTPDCKSILDSRLYVPMTCPLTASLA